MKKDVFKRFITSVVSDGIFPESSIDVQRNLIIHFLYQKYKSNPMKVSTIKEGLKRDFKVVLSSDEVKDCLEKIDQVDKNVEKNETFYQISPEHYSQIDSQKTKNLDSYINLYKGSIDKNADYDICESINKFLYYVANNNLLDFQKIVSNNLKLNPEDKISQEFSLEQINHINEFLKWKNAEKNEIIYKLANIGLEYFILSNTDKYDILKEIGVEEKHFYLDTNILYRALGLNSQYRKDRIGTFLDKCKETQQKIYLTEFTEKEFFDSIKHHCQNIEKYNVRNSKLFIKHSRDNDFYYFYYSWKQTHPNSPISMFISTIRISYRKFIEQYGVTVETGNLFDENTEEVKKLIDYTASEINRYKQSRDTHDNYIFCTLRKAEYDSKNILYIEKKRKEEGTQYSTVKTFMISADHQLLNWDHSRENSMPVVLLPSQWLSLMLRFVSRTSNDFESFVSFINISNKKETIDNEKLNIILFAVSETTEDENAQELIAEALIDQRFDILINSEIKDNIYDSTIKHAQRVKDEKLGELIRAKKQLELDSKKEISKREKEIGQKESEIEAVNKEATEKDKIIESFQDKIRSMEEIDNIKANIINIKKSMWPYFIFILLGSVFLVLLVGFHNQNWNVIWKLFELINSEDNEVYKGVANIVFSGVIIAIISFFSKSIKKIIDKLREIKKLRDKLREIKKLRDNHK